MDRLPVIGSLYGCLPSANSTKLATDLGASLGKSCTTMVPLLVTNVAYSPGPNLAEEAAEWAGALAAGFCCAAAVRAKAPVQAIRAQVRRERRMASLLGNIQGDYTGASSIGQMAATRRCPSQSGHPRPAIEARLRAANGSDPCKSWPCRPAPIKKPQSSGSVSRL